MSQITVDARGHLCPQPLIMTSKALKELAAGDQMTVLIDNETSKQNVCRFLTDNGADAICTEEDGVFTLRVRRVSDEIPDAKVEEYCQAPVAQPHVIVINSDTMGSGSEAPVAFHLLMSPISILSDRPSTYSIA